jgi:hypothetical protein
MQIGDRRGIGGTGDPEQQFLEVRHESSFIDPGRL